MSHPVALVTGASGGIGEALARQLAAEGEDLVLVARSGSRLATVAAEIRREYGREVTALALDLERTDAGDILAAKLAEAGLTVRHLINNAGYGLCGDVADLPLTGQLGIVDLNCRALIDLTVRFLPEIVASRGGVLNVASVAGFTAGPGFAVYYASKALVVSFTRALAYETRELGIRVSALCPGPTATGFGGRAGFVGGRTSRLLDSLDAEGVARAGLAGYRKGRVIVVPGWPNRLARLLLALVPQRLVMPIVASAQRRRHRGTPGGLPETRGLP